MATLGFNNYTENILRNSVNGNTNTRRNFGKKSLKPFNLPPEIFNNGQIQRDFNTVKNKNPNDKGRFDPNTVANNLFIAQNTRENYAGFQKGIVNNEIPYSFLPETAPYIRDVDYNLGGRSFNDSAGYTMRYDNLTELSTPKLDTEFKETKNFNSINQVNPFPIQINNNVKKSLFNNGGVLIS